MFKLDDPFFRPLWVRILIFVICLGWAGFEFLYGNKGWATVFAGLGVYCGYKFFVERRSKE